METVYLHQLADCFASSILPRQVVQWTANPNPRSKNPTQNGEAPRSFVAPKAVGLDSTALPVATVGEKPKGVAQGKPTPTVVDGFDPSRGIDFT